MKKILILFFLPCSVFGQSFVRCNSTEYNKRLKQAHPEIAANEAVLRVKVNEWLSRNQNEPGNDVVNSIITVPVVVHVVWNSSDEDISDQVVQSQIEVINQDYTRTNTDTGQTPLPFRIVAGNPQIQFCLARRTPTNQWTNGIERRQTSVSPFSSSDDVKFYSSGGLDSWNPDLYLNIWVCNLSGGLLGVGALPSAAGSVYDGIVVNYKAFGTTGSSLLPQYNKGRTATHEIGHWLGLYHPWGDDGGACYGDDSIADTPNQANNTYGCPNYPKTDGCSPNFPGVMFMNYMDYTDDECMNMFSYDQAQKMLAVLNTVRTSILSSPACTSVGIEEVDFSNSIEVFPNPAENQFRIEGSWQRVDDEIIMVQLYNIIGECICSSELKVENSQFKTIVDVSSFARGIYQLALRSKNGIASKRISVVK